MLSVVEDYLENVAINPRDNLQQNEENIAVYSQDLNQTEFQGAGAESLTTEKKQNNFSVYYNDISVRTAISQISLTMPRSLFEGLNIDSKSQNQRISFIVYRMTPLFQSRVENDTIEGETVNKLNSWVISGSIKGQKLTNLKDPIVTTYEPLKEGIHEKTRCVFWDFTLKNGLGDWSGAGCTFTGIKDGVVTCHCFHLTNFAILTVRDRHIAQYMQQHIDFFQKLLVK
jgi:hypothetical protein